MKTLLTALSFLILLSGQAQKKINLALKNELDSMYALDQKYRAILSEDMERKADSLASAYHIQKKELSMYLWKLQTQIDSSNLHRIEAIIRQYGYPGRSLVDSPANEAAFYVLQHSKVIDSYLPLVEKAAMNKELPFRLYAMMLDRSLMYQGKEQIYGTQASGFQVTNTKSGQKEFVWLIWPIRDAASVNERRKAAGFDQTVEENARRLNINYKVYTLEEVQRMKEGK